VGVHLGVIGLHPLHFPPFVRVCFTPKHNLGFMGHCTSHFIANSMLRLWQLNRGPSSSSSSDYTTNWGWMQMHLYSIRVTYLGDWLIFIQNGRWILCRCCQICSTIHLLTPLNVDGATCSVPFRFSNQFYMKISISGAKLQMFLLSTTLLVPFNIVVWVGI
jgi:hypothetical protein